MRFDYFDPKLDKWIKYFRSLTPEQERTVDFASGAETKEGQTVNHDCFSCHGDGCILCDYTGHN